MKADDDMGTTITTIAGFGIKVDKDEYNRNHDYPLIYPTDQLLDPDDGNWSELCVERSGFAARQEDDWVFLKPTITRIYSGISGNGMDAPLPSQELSKDMLTGLSQLQELMELRNITGEPGWHMVTWIN